MAAKKKQIMKLTDSKAYNELVEQQSQLSEKKQELRSKLTELESQLAETGHATEYDNAAIGYLGEGGNTAVLSGLKSRVALSEEIKAAQNEIAAITVAEQPLEQERLKLRSELQAEILKNVQPEIDAKRQEIFDTVVRLIELKGEAVNLVDRLTRDSQSPGIPNSMLPPNLASVCRQLSSIDIPWLERRCGSQESK